MVPVRAVLHNPLGSIGGRQPANTTMRAHMVVIVAPEPQHRAGVAQRYEQRLVEAFVAQTAVEALDIAVLLRLAGRDIVPLDRPLLSIGVQKGPPIGVQKGPRLSSGVTGMAGVPFALVAA